MASGIISCSFHFSILTEFETEFSAEIPDRKHRSLSDNDHVQPDAEEDLDLPVETQANSSLATWINKERFPKFVKVTRARFSHLLNTKKLLVMAVLEENKIGHISPEMEEFKAMLMQVGPRFLLVGPQSFSRERLPANLLWPLECKLALGRVA